MPMICEMCGHKNRDGAHFCAVCRTPLSASHAAISRMTGMLQTGMMLANRYLVQRLIGQGGMGAVYLAADTRIFGKEWVVKEMSDAALAPAERQTAVMIFQREAQILATLEHPNLPRVVDFFTDGGRHYLVMDYVAGETLDTTLTKSGPLAEVQVLALAEQLCAVLDYLHHQSSPIIFRDLKPENIMVTPHGQLKLIDFGIARHFTPGQTKDTLSLGTPGFAPPEQYGKGQTDVRSDIYAFGATLHYLLTGRDPREAPFNFPPARSLKPDISYGTDAAIQRALKPNPSDRFSSVKEMCLALHSREPSGVRSTETRTSLEAVAPVREQRTTPTARLSQMLRPISLLLPGARTSSMVGPILTLPHKILNFGQLHPGKSAKRPLVIENRGRQSLTGSLLPRTPWIHVRSRIKIRGGRAIKVPVGVRTKGLTPGHHAGEIGITSPGGDATVAVKMRVVGADAVAPCDRVEIPLKDNPAAKLAEVLVGRQGVIDKLGTWIATTSEQMPRTFLITGYGSFGGTTVVRKALEDACESLAGRKRRANKADVLLVATLDMTKVPTRDLTKERLLRLLTLELYARVEGSEFDDELRKRIEGIRELQELCPRKENIVTEIKTESGQVRYGIHFPPTISATKVLEIGSLLDLDRQPKTETRRTATTVEYERLLDPDLVLAELHTLLESVTGRKRQKRGRPFSKGFKLPERTVIVVDKVEDLEKLSVLRQVTDVRNVPCILVVDRKHYDMWVTQHNGEQEFKQVYRIDDVIKLENMPGTVEDVCAALVDSGRISSEEHEVLETHLRNIVVQTQGTAGGGVKQLISECQPRHKQRWGKRQTAWTISFKKPDGTAKRMAYFQSHIEQGDTEFFPSQLSQEEQERVKQGLYCLLPWIVAHEKLDSPRFKSTEIRREAERCCPHIVVMGSPTGLVIASQALREQIVFAFLNWLIKEGYTERRGSYWYYLDSNWQPPVG